MANMFRQGRMSLLGHHDAYAVSQKAPFDRVGCWIPTDGISDVDGIVR
jgi:hypothetical protein